MGSLSPHLLLSVFATCFGSSFLIGFNIGLVNLTEDFIKKFLAKSYNITDEDKKTVLYALVSSVHVIFAAIGAFTCGWVADFFGRRNSLLINNAIGITGSFIAAFCCLANAPALLYLGRAISGINNGVSIGIASIYLTEIAPRQLRGIIGACHQLAVTGGIFISYLVTLTSVLNKENQWPIAIGLGAIPPFLSLFMLPFCPESARFLYLLKNNEVGARAALQKLHANGNVDMLIAEMEAEKEVARNQPKFRFIQLFSQRDLCMPVLIAIFIQVLQQLSGINAVMANSQLILKTAKVEADHLEYYVLASGFLNVICTIIALPLLERAGRRTLLLWPTLCLAATLLLQCIIVNVLNSKPPDEQRPFAVAAAVLIFIYVACFAVGLGPIPALIVSEIFRQGPRSAAYSLSQCVQWLSNLLVLTTFPTLNYSLKGYVYLPFFVVVVCCWLFFFLFMPETKGRTFDEVANSLAFGTIVFGKRTTEIQAPVFSKEDNEELPTAKPLLTNNSAKPDASGIS